MAVRPYRSTASFGKRQEYVAIGELLSRGFDVYATLVDDQQIDCILRLHTRKEPHYLDIQIKARSGTAKQAGTFSAFAIRKPRKNFFFIFYCEAINRYWVIPSIELAKLANVNKGGDDGQGLNRGKFSIVLAKKVAGGWSARPKFRQFENAFHLLR